MAALQLMWKIYITQIVRENCGIWSIFPFRRNYNWAGATKEWPHKTSLLQRIANINGPPNKGESYYRDEYDKMGTTTKRRLPFAISRFVGHLRGNGASLLQTPFLFSSMNGVCRLRIVFATLQASLVARSPFQFPHWLLTWAFRRCDCIVFKWPAM